ncbi:hypothetical protein ACFLYD_06520 [Chloroflexota bacterium]
MTVRLWTRLDPGWLLVILLTVFAIAPLTYPGFFEVESGFLSVFNAEHLSDAPNWGRATDLVRGEGKLPYLLVWPFFQLLASGVVAVKWGYALTLVLGSLGTFAWARRWLGARGGVLSSAVYTYLPWHLSAIYVRGAYAEAWLWAFWPFVLWALDRWGEGRLLPAVLAGAPVLAAALFTQPGMLALSLPLLVAYGVVVAARQPWPILRIVAAVALTLLLLWVVAQIVPGARLPFSEHFLHPFQLLTAAWDEGPSFQLGLAGVGLSIVAVALWASNRSSGPRGSRSEPSMPSTSLGRALTFWLANLLVLVLLTLPLSSFIWRITGFEVFVTHPWQLLALAGLPLAFLAGSTVRLDERLAILPAWAGLIAFVILASYPYLAPRFTSVVSGPEPVAMFQPPEVDAPQIMVLDYEVTPPTEITPTLTLTLTWQAVEPVTDDYTMFVHVLSGGDARAAQRDTRPCDGACPTNTWQPGEIIVDRVQLSLDPDAPAGPYRLAMGLYLLDTGERVAVVGRDDRTVFLDVP